MERNLLINFFLNLFKQKGIMHQTTCIYTPPTKWGFGKKKPSST
jgi:hypothetical protein